MDNLLKEGNATFGIYDKNLEHRDDDPFIMWLKSEGFRVQSFGHTNSDHFLYVNVNSKVYNWGMAGAGLCSVLFDHAIHIDEFKQIYAIFKKYEGISMGCYSAEEQKALDETKIRMEEQKQENERARIAYFEQNPSYEQWCEDIKDILLQDPYYSKNYDKEHIESDMEYYARDLHKYYDEQESPKSIAGQWSIITF